MNIRASYIKKVFGLIACLALISLRPAQAVASVWITDSSYKYTPGSDLPAPVVSADNTTFAESMRFTLSPGCRQSEQCPKGYVIYTLDGTEPLRSSTARVYETPVEINSSTILRARFVSETEPLRYSPELVKKYSRIKVLPAPVAKPARDEFVISDTISLNVSGFDQDPDVQIYYTLNGQDPLAEGEQYKTPFVITDTTTVKAVAVSHSGVLLNSKPLIRRFVRTYPRLPAPSISPKKRNFLSPFEAKIHVPGFESDSLVTLVYTIQKGDSSVTFESKTSGGINIDTTTSVSVYAKHPGYSRSHSSVYRYVKGDVPVVETPKVSPRGGKFGGEPVELTLQVEDPKAMITYTLDGSEPTQGSLLYRGEPFLIHDDCTLKARAFRTNQEPGAVIEEVYRFSPLAAPQASVQSGTVFDDSIKVALEVPGFENDPDVRIYYALDGLEPTDSSRVYDDTLVLSSSTTLSMFAQRPYYNASETVTYEYYCTRMVTGASYFDEDGDGRIETALVELDGSISRVPGRLYLADPVNNRERVFDSTNLSFENSFRNSFGKFRVSIRPPFSFGTRVPNDVWGSLPLSGDFDVTPFGISDRAGPVIKSARMQIGKDSPKDTLLITFSESVQSGAIDGKIPGDLFSVTGALRNPFENSRDPIKMVNDSSCKIFITGTRGYADMLSAGSIALKANGASSSVTDLNGNPASPRNRAVKIAISSKSEWEVMAISPFTPGKNRVPDYISALPGIQSNTGTVIMISSSRILTAAATIYDPTGNVIRRDMRFVYNHRDKKQYLVWDGTNSRGEFVSSGTYLVAVGIDDGKTDQSGVKYIKIAVKQQ